MPCSIALSGNAMAERWRLIALTALEDPNLCLRHLIAWSPQDLDQDKVMWINNQPSGLGVEAGVVPAQPSSSSEGGALIRVPRSGHYLKRSLFYGAKEDAPLPPFDPKAFDPKSIDPKSIDPMGGSGGSNESDTSLLLLKDLMPKLDLILDILPSFTWTPTSTEAPPPSSSSASEGGGPPLAQRVELGPEEVLVKFKGYHPAWVPKELLLKANASYAAEAKESKEGLGDAAEAIINAAVAAAPKASGTGNDLIKMIASARAKVAEAIRADRLRFELQGGGGGGSGEGSGARRVRAELGLPDSPLLVLDTEEKHTSLVQDLAKRAKEVVRSAVFSAKYGKPATDEKTAKSAAPPPPPPQKAASLLSPDEVKTKAGGGYAPLNLTHAKVNATSALPVPKPQAQLPTLPPPAVQSNKVGDQPRSS